eukprot:gene19614-biopygen2449
MVPLPQGGPQGRGGPAGTAEPPPQAPKLPTPITAVADERLRVLYVAVKLNRMQLSILNMYDVYKSWPSMVDGTGGTLVTVKGNGFPLRLGAQDNKLTVACKWGDTSYMGSHINNVIIFSVTPSIQVLQSETAIELRGTGFLNSPYITCKINRELTTATWVSSVSMRCTHPKTNTPSQTTIEVSMDGQQFSNSVESEDRALRSFNVSARVTGPDPSRQAPCESGPCGTLQGLVSQPIVNGQVNFTATDLWLEYPGRGSYVLYFEVIDDSVDCRGDGINAPVSTCVASVVVNSTSGETRIIRAAEIPFEVTATATRLQFVTEPTYYATTKERLPVQPILKFTDVSDNIAITHNEDVNILLDRCDHGTELVPRLCVRDTGDEIREPSAHSAGTRLYRCSKM